MTSKAAEKSDGLVRPRGLLYIGHLPFGFYHEALTEYFSQFGNVTNVKVPRSQKTGGYKGYAFVEFESPEVAKIAAEATDNYIIDRKVLRASYIPPEDQLHPVLKPGMQFVATHRVPQTIRLANMDAAVGLSKNALKRKEKKYVKTRSTLEDFGVKDYDELPIDLKNLEERIKESENRAKRVEQLKAEKAAYKGKRSKSWKKKRRYSPENDNNEQESDDEFISENVIDTFEKAIEALKGETGKLNETDGSSELPSSYKIDTSEEQESAKVGKIGEIEEPCDVDEIPLSVNDSKHSESATGKNNRRTPRTKNAISDSTKELTTTTEDVKPTAAGKNTNRKRKANDAKDNPLKTEPESAPYAKELKADRKKSLRKEKKSVNQSDNKKLKQQILSKTNSEAEDEALSPSSSKRKKSGTKQKTSKVNVQVCTESGQVKTSARSKIKKANAVSNADPQSASAAPDQPKKQFPKRDTVEKFRHRIKNITYKYMS